MDKQGLHRELKWTKMSTEHLPRYVAVMRSFVELVREDRLKVRVMFTKNSNVALA